MCYTAASASVPTSLTIKIDEYRSTYTGSRSAAAILLMTIFEHRRLALDHDSVMAAHFATIVQLCSRAPDLLQIFMHIKFFLVVGLAFGNVGDLCSSGMDVRLVDSTSFHID